MTQGKAKILDSHDISAAVKALQAGDVVGMPTETVYGLAGNAFDVAAVTKIFAAKERPSFDPLIVHVSADKTSVERLASAELIDTVAMSPGMTRITESLIRAFWPGPLTMILPKHHKIPDLVTSGLDRVGLRMPAHAVAQKLLTESKCPLAAPSANRFGRISPTTAAHVFDELGDRISWIIDGGPCDVGVESTVVAVDDEQIWLLRPGKISAAELANCSGVAVTRAPNIHEKASPGMLASHYAPKKTMRIISDLKTVKNLTPAGADPKRFSLLVLSGDGVPELAALKAFGMAPVAINCLSPKGDASEAARRLFSAMRTLDQSECDFILTTSAPSSEGLWLAIMDRVTRAATP
jgi:L-threonylcarbamoyladenylate synthase